MSDWIRVEKRNVREPCPICGHWGWCMVNRDGNAVICPRTPDGCVKYLGEAGYLHLLNGGSEQRLRIQRLPVRKLPPSPPPKPVEWPKLVTEYRNNCSEEDLHRLAKAIGVGTDDLYRLEVGKTDKGAWSFPMRNELDKVCGIRIRSNNGQKWAYPGSRNGLFIPRELAGEQLFICEGPTDTAALISIGLNAIGRASCTSGNDMLTKLCRRDTWPEVVIVSDNDDNEVGEYGARKLADALYGKVWSLRVIFPPRHKDVRDWVRSGATKAEILNQVDYAIAYNEVAVAS